MGSGEMTEPDKPELPSIKEEAALFEPAMTQSDVVSSEKQPAMRFVGLAWIGQKIWQLATRKR